MLLVRLALLVALSWSTGLSGCGPATPGERSNPTSTAVPETDRPVSTQTSGRGPGTRPSSTTSGPRRIESCRGPNPVPDACAPSTAASSDRKPLGQGAATDRGQDEARVQWYAEARQSPDVTVRLQALEQWAQQPDDELDSVIDALEDEDAQVRARAQALWEQREAEAGVSSSSDGSPG